MDADFALADQAILARMDELDRILDRQDMALDARIEVIDHRRERGRLARAGLAGHEDHAVRDFAQVAHRLRHLEWLERLRLRRDGAKHGAHAVELAQYVHPKPGKRA